MSELKKLTPEESRALVEDLIREVNNTIHEHLDKIHEKQRWLVACRVINFFIAQLYSPIVRASFQTSSATIQSTTPEGEKEGE